MTDAEAIVPLRGIWPPVLIQSGRDGWIDLDGVVALTKHFAAGGVAGVYTGDTASEFHTLEFEEWNDLATCFREVAMSVGLTAAIGCTWTNMAGALRRIDRARELGYHSIHLSQPYWFPLNQPAQRDFWTGVAAHAGDLGVVVYGGSQGQFAIDGSVVQRLRDWCPSIVGTKTLGFDAVATNSLLALCPDLAHFVHEQVLAPWVGLGAAGCFSNLACLSAPFTVHWFNLIAAGRWDEAFTIQRAVARFYEHGAVPIRRAGYQIDRSLAELGGCPGITRPQRAPYQAVPDDLYAKLADAARAYIPQSLTWAGS